MNIEKLTIIDTFEKAKVSFKNKVDQIPMTAAARSSLLCEIYYMEEAFNQLSKLSNKK